MKFHVNAMGKALKCSAKQGKCPFGDSDDHYNSASDARRAYENHMQEEFTKALSGFTKNTSKYLDPLRYLPEHPDSVIREETLKTAIREKRRLSAFERAKHEIYVEEVIRSLEERNQTTDQTHARTTSRGLVFTPERALAHSEIINEIMDEAESVPSRGEALFAGGLGGAGKSTVLKEFAGIDKSQYITLNPDDIKEIMAEKGLIPKVEGLTPMEASPLVHEEASHITSVILEKLRHRRKNIIFDITMASEKSVQNRINLLTESGYSKIEAIFVDISPETSSERGSIRYVQGIDQYTEQGKGQGGRPLPKRLTAAQSASNPQFKSKNAENLISLSKLNSFTSSPRVFDNNVSGRDPKELSFVNFSNGFYQN